MIYECHVRGMTKRHSGVDEALRGTYLGLAADPVIDHLLSLGVTASLTAVGKSVIIATMFIGRVGPLTLALALGREPLDDRLGDAGGPGRDARRSRQRDHHLRRDLRRSGDRRRDLRQRHELGRLRGRDRALVGQHRERRGVQGRHRRHLDALFALRRGHRGVELHADLDVPHHARLAHRVAADLLDERPRLAGVTARIVVEPRGAEDPVVKELRPHIQQLVDELLDRAEPGGAMDLIADLAYPLPVTVICELLGIPEAQRADVGGWFRTLLGPPSYADAVAASESIIGYLTALLALKRAEPGEDLVTDLVTAADGDGSLTEQEMRSTIFQLIVAGHDTTASFIGNSIVALFRNPDQLALLRTDPGRLEMALEVCTQYEKAKVMTGRPNGATGDEFAQYVLDTVRDPGLESKWRSYQASA